MPILPRSLRTQLLLSHLGLVALMALVMCVAVVHFLRLGKSVDRILTDNYTSVVAAQDMKDSLERQDSATAFFIAGERARARTQYRTNVPLFDAAYAIEAGNITEPGERELADALGREYAAYRREAEHLLFGVPEMPKAEAGTYYFETLEPRFQSVKGHVEQILSLNERAIERADAQARADAARAIRVSIATTLGALLVALLVALRTVPAALAPLRSLARQAEEIGAGHLDQRIEVRQPDEIGALASAFNGMAAKLGAARGTLEERLHRAERMSDVALESLYDPVVVTDAAGRVVHLNRAAEGLFGPAARARGQWARAVVQQDRLAYAIERAVKQEQVSAEEGESAQARFGQRTYRLRANPMTDEAGTLLGAVAVLEDVTHLTELDRLKTEFIGVASHELRTPVTALLLSVQLLEEGAAGPLTPEQMEVVRAQRQDLERLERMMRDLLDMTRLEAGATPPRFEMVAPAEIVRHAAAVVTPQASARSLTLTVRLPQGDLPPVRADRAQIGRVLLNLLSNAIRHTPPGGSVTVEAGEVEGDEEGGIRFSVSDTGEGIPGNYLPLLFQRFVQVPGTTRGGSGLGLALSHSIVRAHGGRLRVESTLGEGSRFWFTIPATSAAAAVEEAATVRTGTG